jgi:superfamily II DNA or RNA helicase
MVVDSVLTIEIPELSKKQWEKLESKLTFVNDGGDVVSAYRRYITKGHYKLPRGAWYLLPDSIRYKDRRVFPPMPKLNFNVKLNDTKKDERFAGQKEALAAMLEHEQGLVIRPPGTGKTQIALAFAAACQTRTLVLVHTEDILNQWVEYAAKALPGTEIGVIQGKQCRIGHVTIATVQTMQRYIGKGSKWWAQFGALIADEAHHVSAPSWEGVINACPARYRFGFTASPTRADGMHPTMKFIIGPIIHRQKFSSPVKLEVVPVKTKFYAPFRHKGDWSNLVSKLVLDTARNKQIAKIADREIEKGNSVLVLSRRIEHLERIAALMHSDTEILAAASRSKADRKDVLANFRSGTIRCVLATQLADEALDVPILNRVILAHPGKHEGRIIQQIGRAIRQHAGKQDAVIYDIVDPKVSVLKRQWNERKRTYKTARISVRSTGTLKWRS